MDLNTASLVILIVMSTYVYFIRSTSLSFHKHLHEQLSYVGVPEMNTYQLSFCFLLLLSYDSSAWVVMYLVSSMSQPLQTVRVLTNDD